MDSIKMEKIYDDIDLCEVKVTITSEFISIYQSYYIGNEYLNKVGDTLLNFSFTPKEDVYLEFGVKGENYAPAFSLLFFAADKKGHVTIEVDMEIEDSPNEKNRRKHCASFYIHTELGLIENFSKEILLMSEHRGYSFATLGG